MRNAQVKIEKIAEVHKVDFNGQMILGVWEDLEELCLALEEYLYDEPTYKELNEKVVTLEYCNENLKKEINELHERVIDIRTIRRFG